MTPSTFRPSELGNRFVLPLAQHYYATRIKLTGKSCQFLVILSHMRAGSSLLVHLLNTHPKICGYGETHSSYESENSLLKLVGNIKYHLKQSGLDEDVFVDKLLHDGHVISKEVAALPNVKFLFLVREPQAAVASMLKLWPHKRTEAGRVKAIEYYSNYYISRLNGLEFQAAQIADKHRMLFLTHDDMVNRTDATFTAFQELLQVDASFSEQYEITPVTGKVGVGDPSVTIATGQIVRSSKLAAEIALKPGCLEAFDDCTRSLSDRCLTLAPAVSLGV